MAVATAGATNFNVAKSKNVTEITNKISNIVRNEVTQDVMASVALEQRINISALDDIVLVGTDIVQFNNTVLSAIQKNKSLTEAINEFANEVTQDAESSTPELFNISMGIVVGLVNSHTISDIFLSAIAVLNEEYFLFEYYIS